METEIAVILHAIFLATVNGFALLACIIVGCCICVFLIKRFDCKVWIFTFLISCLCILLFISAYGTLKGQ